jgi:hypothetical protein
LTEAQTLFGLGVLPDDYAKQLGGSSAMTDIADLNGDLKAARQ